MSPRREFWALGALLTGNSAAIKGNEKFPDEEEKKISLRGQLPP